MNRYLRQEQFTPLGIGGQARIRESAVLLVGVGATGSALAESLVRAGIGELRLFDRDLVEEGNLARQALYTEEDIGRPKAEAARQRLAAMNSEVEIHAQVVDARPGILEPWLDGIGLILDGTDNFHSRFFLNDLALREKIPWIYTAAVGETAICMPVLPGETACLQCLYPEMPEDGPSCDTGGILHATVMAAAAMSAAEALKILAGRPEAVIRKLRHRELWTGRRANLSTAKTREGCSACSGNYRHLDPIDDTLHVVARCSNSCQISPAPGSPPPNLEILGRMQGAKPGPYALEIELDGIAFSIFPDGQAIAEGSGNRKQVARLYRRLMEETHR
jgi:molybdopterin-synthase adenylyltransferase